ncbi:hypothetical protein C8J57DRAFT_52894 [Mycena rebaudengoi]|nr:hypothetical protein C8J57DRAFT_52894 [Mycena rebaudengoi]
MSYAAVAAHHAPPPSQQPHADPALLNTTPESVPPPGVTASGMPSTSSSKPDPSHSSQRERERRMHRHIEETKAEGAYLWDTAKHYLFRPGVAGGLIGLVNIGLLAGAARAFYAQPHLRRDPTALSGTIAGALAILSAEAFAGEAYRKTAAGQAEERRAKEEGAAIYRHARERILRPGTLGGLVGVLNLAILGGVGYASYVHWDRPTWDRRVVSAVVAGLLVLSGGEGILAEKYSEQHHM